MVIFLFVVEFVGRGLEVKAGLFIFLIVSLERGIFRFRFFIFG